MQNGRGFIPRIPTGKREESIMFTAAGWEKRRKHLRKRIEAETDIYVDTDYCVCTKERENEGIVFLIDIMCSLFFDNCGIN